MAGGAKETPRQRMIGMMYLVLTALLALQVDNSLLDKFLLIDESIRKSVEITFEKNEAIVNSIHETVEKNGNKASDIRVMKKADEVKQLTASIMEKIENIRKTVIEAAGGIDPETGRIVNGKDYDAQMTRTLGPGTTKTGEAYALQTSMNQFAADLNKILDELPPVEGRQKIVFEPLAVDPSEDPNFKGDPIQRKKDWPNYKFDHSPADACMAIISQLNAEAVQYESQALDYLAASIGAEQLKFDRIVAVVKPKSSVVAAGTKYSAEMFLAASSTTSRPKMYFGDNEVKVEEGTGTIEFTAQGGTYDAEGNAKKSWTGRIVLSRPSGDTTFAITEEYIVAKPVIQVQAAAVSALYFNCGNELNVQVPALGTAYEPSFTANGADVIPGAQKGRVTLVPNARKVTLNVASSGNALGSENFNVREVPKPTVVILNGNKPVNMQQGENASMLRAVSISARPDKEFAEFLPKDARFRIAEGSVTLARGKRALGTVAINPEGPTNLNTLAGQAKEGDRYTVEIKRIIRRNFRDQNEDVKGVYEIINVPLN